MKAESRLTFEYVLMDDVNDSPEDAEILVELIRGTECRVNLIPYNKVSGKSLLQAGAKGFKFPENIKGIQDKRAYKKGKGRGY